MYCENNYDISRDYCNSDYDNDNNINNTEHHKTTSIDNINYIDTHSISTSKQDNNNKSWIHIAWTPDDITKEHSYLLLKAHSKKKIQNLQNISHSDIFCRILYILCPLYQGHSIIYPHPDVISP
eukprot:123581_1